MASCITLRQYQQEEIIDPLMAYLAEHEGNPVVAAPTGTGKSLAINGFIRQSLEADPSLRIMVVAHVKEIVGQNAQGMLDYWKSAPLGIFHAGLKQFNTTASLIYGGIHSVYNKAEQFGVIDAVVCDEAHTLSDRESSMWQKFIRTLRRKNENLRVIGFTATPFKLSVGLLTEMELFDKMVVDLTRTERINKFVQDGYLCPLISRKPAAEIDIQNVALKNGEFDPVELEAVTDRDALNKSVVKECIKHGGDRKHWLCYATSVRHAGHLVDCFRAHGITCEMLTGTDSDERRTELIGDKLSGTIGDFQRGKFRCLVNCSVLTTGFDFPALDLIALARATQSTGLYVQTLGRGTRPYPGKENCLVLDFGANITRLGPFNCPVIPKSRRKGDDVVGEAPVKACAVCGLYVHTSVRVCPECGTEFPISSKLDKVSSSAKVMIESSVVPVHEILPISQVFYSVKDTKAGPALRVGYGGMLKELSEYWFPESPYSWQVKEFQKRWTAAGGVNPYPATAEEANDRARRELRVPKQVQYESNTKYKNVVRRDYD